MFEDIEFKVVDKSTGKNKIILDKISGVVHPGEVLAVMGPSGSGKTSLLDFLADRLSSGTRLGTVYVNGTQRDEQTYKHIAKYVPQEDSLLGTSSVKETLDFAASLSLPPHVSVKDREKRVEEVIQELGLSSCRDTRIGTVFQKGVSGGQKRRVSMGVELISKPQILFLDEPTSGLDSAAAFHVINVCKKLASSGHTVVCTIHQPSSEVFHKLDKLLLLSGGQLVYFGKTEHAIDYFAKAGFPCPQYTNPADFFMEVINEDFNDEGSSQKGNVEKLVQLYKQGELAKEVAEDIANTKQLQLNQHVMEEASFSNGFLSQFWTITRRTWSDNMRNPGIFWVRTVMYTLLSIMIATIYWDIGTGETDIQDRISVMFFIMAFLVFMSIAAIPAFIQDRTVFSRERSNGWYSVGPYVLANTLCGIPGLFLMAGISTLIVYPSVGLNPIAGRWLLFLLDLFLSLWVAESIMLVLSAIVPIYIVGMALGAGLFGMFMLVTGFFVLPENLPSYWVWGYYIGMHTYSFEMFMWTEFDSLDIQSTRFASGEDLLKWYDMENVSVVTDILVLLAMMVIYRFIFYLILNKFHTGKR